MTVRVQASRRTQNTSWGLASNVMFNWNFVSSPGRQNTGDGGRVVGGGVTRGAREVGGFVGGRMGGAVVGLVDMI